MGAHREPHVLDDEEPTTREDPWVLAGRRVAASNPADATTGPEARAAAEDQAATAPAVDLVFLGAHGGAGVTTWASILGGRDAGAIPPTRALGPGASTAVPVLVARASVTGIEAAKRALADRDPASGPRVSRLLIVAAAPGRTPRLIQHELRVLRGAGLPVATTPWIGALLLRRPETASPTEVGLKELERIRVELQLTDRLVEQPHPSATSAPSPHPEGEQS